MSFVIFVCADIFGEKINLEFPFKEPPASLDGLYRMLEHVFSAEESEIKQKNVELSSRIFERFVISRIQRYLDDIQSWVGLDDTRDLQRHDQLYVFRKNATRLDISTQREIPPPRSSPFFYTFYDFGVGNNLECEPAQSIAGDVKTSLLSRPLVAQQLDFLAASKNYSGQNLNYATKNMAARSTVNSDSFSRSDAVNLPVTGTGCNSVSTHSERLTQEEVEVVFRMADSAQKDYLTVEDILNIFCACQIEFSRDVLRELFCAFAKKQQGELVMSFQDFCNYASEFVHTIAVVYTRLSNQEQQKIIEKKQRENSTTIKELQMQKRILEERLGAIIKQIAAEENRKASLQSEADELMRAKDPHFCDQEQKLLEKEVSIFCYRQKLREEEMDFERLAAERQKLRAATLTFSRISTHPLRR